MNLLKLNILNWKPQQTVDESLLILLLPLNLWLQI